MAAFDPDVFGAPATAGQGFDPDVFSAGSVASNRQAIGAAKQEPPEGSDALGGLSQGVLNLLAGGVRGAGSIGATLAYPVDKAMDLYYGDRGKNLSSLITGKELPSRNEERRARLDENLQQLVGAQPDSWMYRGGKLGGEIAGTAGVGGLVGKGVGFVASKAPDLAPVLDPLATAISTGGFRTGTVLPAAQNVATRAAGGAISGGAIAGAVDPKDALSGAAIGGALPLFAQAAGRTGDLLNSAFQRGAQPNARTLETARQSMDAGYVIPPNMLQPGFKNQVIESISGKQATQQIASMKNTEVTEGLVRKALGIPEDVPLTQSALENLRKTAGKAYAEVSSISPQAASDLEALKQARNEAQGWFKAYNRSASPVDLAKAKEFRATADNLESWLEYHAADAGRSDLIPALRDARKEIAKTYTVGRALNDASGTVDARVLGRMYEKGLPLSDGLDTAGRFASAFPSVAKSPQQVGSPAAHNLKSLASMLMGGAGYAGAGPLGVAAAALPFVAPPLARAQMFSSGAQRALFDTAPLLSDQPLGLFTEGAYRLSPLLAGQRP